MTSTGFLDLPAELRIRIYEYALDPLADPGIWTLFNPRKGHDQISCCASISRKHARRCDCARNEIAVGLLRVSKQVFAEAMPVLCSLYELRVRIPSSDSSADVKELTKILKRMPEYTHPHMRQVLLVSETVSARGGFPHYGHEDDVSTFRTNRCDGLGGMDKYWKTIQRQLPQIRHVRIHLDVWTEEVKNLKFALWAFKGLKKLPKLQLVELQLHQRMGEAPWTKRFMEDMQAALICKFMQLIDGAFEIDLQLMERKWIDSFSLGAYV